MPPRPRNMYKRAACRLLLGVLPALAGAQDAGPDSFEEAPAIQQLIREESQQGNAVAAWKLEQGLLRLTERYPDDVRSARILRAAGNRRTAVLARYDAGEVPPEIVLGCYYRARWWGPDLRDVLPITPCTSGSRRVARRALAADALGFYVESARIMLHSEAAAGEELIELLMQLLASSYQNSAYEIGRWSLESLLEQQEANSASWLRKAHTLALMGDWDSLFARYLGTKLNSSALEAYEQALSLLVEHGVAEDAVDAIFSPQIPIELPTFTTNRLTSDRTGDSSGFVDISFDIQNDGKSARIEVNDSSADLPRSAERDLVNAVRHGRFRPIAANGRILESAPVTVRYYIND